MSAWGLGCHLSLPLESGGHATTWDHTNLSDLCCLPDHDHIWVQAVATGYVWVHGPNVVRVCADVRWVVLSPGAMEELALVACALES